MPHLHQATSILLSLVTAVILIIESVAAFPLNLTDPSSQPRCLPSRPARYRSLDPGDCRDVILKFQHRYSNAQYLLTHDPSRASIYSILCPYSQFSGDCSLIVDFTPGYVEHLRPTKAVQAAMQVVDSCVGKRDVDGGAVYLDNGKIRLMLAHTPGLSLPDGSVNGSYVLPANGDAQPSGPIATS